MKYFFLTIAVFCSFSVFSQSAPGLSSGKGIVAGVVESSSGKYIEYANVVLFSVIDSTMVTGTISNERGAFVLPDVPYGKYWVEANFIGFEKKASDVFIVNQQNKEVKLPLITLEVASVKVDDIYVTSSQAQVEYKIDKKVVTVGKDFVASSGTAADVLENVPSVDVDIEGNVSLRGSSDFTVLINGRPSVLEGNDALQQLSSSQIQSIEIITNPSAKYDPEGTAGIINVITKKSKLEGFSGIINTNIGTNNKYSADALLNYKFEHINLFAGFDYRDDKYLGERAIERITRLEGFNEHLLSDGSRNMNRGGISGRIGADIYLGENTTLGLSGKTGVFTFGFGGEMNNTTWVDSLKGTSDYEYTINESDLSFERYYKDANMNFRHQFTSPKHYVQASVNYSYREGGNPDTSVEKYSNINWAGNGIIKDSHLTTEDSKDDEMQLKVDYSQPTAHEGKFEAGLAFDLESENEVYRHISFERDTFNNEMDAQKDIYAAYTTYGLQLGLLGIQAGLRYEYTDRSISDASNDTVFVLNRHDIFPSLHMSVQLAGNNQLQASYSKRINRPRSWYLEPFISFRDAYNRFQGNPDLKPEYTHSFELGWQKRWGKSFIAAEGFYKYTLNPIDRLRIPLTNNISLHRPVNLAWEENSGAEVMLNYIYKRWLNLNSSTSVYYYNFKGSNTENINSGNGVTWNTRLNATISPSPKMRLQIRGGYRGDQETASGVRLGNLTSGAALRYNWLAGKLSTTLQIHDIFGTHQREITQDTESYYEYARRSREPRVVSLSLTYKFNDYKQRKNADERGAMDMGGGGDDF